MSMDQDSADEAGQDNAETGSVLKVPGQTHGSSQAVAQDHTIVHQEAKWKRLRKHYRDRYLEIFLEYQTQNDNTPQITGSQLGSVTWTSLEKATFFDALAGTGRQDLPRLAAAIGTKSIVEVRDYLCRLKEADAEHQMFAKHAKNVSLADIDAAIEINTDLESRLEQAADALSAFQDNFDLAKARGNQSLWLIDAEIAQRIDEENEQKENEEMADSTEQVSPDPASNGALQFFHFQTLLDLSRSVFMNSATESEHGHWTEYAEEDEEPVLTVEATEVFYNLVKGLVQRVLQTSIFLAQSRIRSTSSPDYTPSNILKDVDVTAALDVLNMPLDSWDYWTNFARRSGAQVVLGEHRKGQNKPLTLQQIEETLSIRSSRGRHRSLSTVLSHSSPGHETDSEQEAEETVVQEDLSKSIEVDSESGISGGGSEEETHSVYITDQEDGGDTEDREAHISNSPSPAQPKMNISHKRRRMLMEESQETFLDSIDRVAQAKEEHFLEQILGTDVVKIEPEEQLLKRPRVSRKTKEDLRDWANKTYYSEWETNRPSSEGLENDERGI